MLLLLRLGEGQNGWAVRGHPAWHLPGGQLGVPGQGGGILEQKNGLKALQQLLRGLKLCSTGSLIPPHQHLCWAEPRDHKIELSIYKVPDFQTSCTCENTAVRFEFPAFPWL